MPNVGERSWLTFLGNAKDSLWSIDLILLHSRWVLVVMDQFTRRIIGVGAHAADVDGSALCSMFNTAVSTQGVPYYPSSDNDPLFLYHRWQASLRILGVDEIKTVPYTPQSHPFVERLIRTVRREYLDHLFSGKLRILSENALNSGNTTTASGFVIRWAEIPSLDVEISVTFHGYPTAMDFFRLLSPHAKEFASHTPACVRIRPSSRAWWPKSSAGKCLFPTWRARCSRVRKSVVPVSRPANASLCGISPATATLRRSTNRKPSLAIASIRVCFNIMQGCTTSAGVSAQSV